MLSAQMGCHTVQSLKPSIPPGGTHLPYAACTILSRCHVNTVIKPQTPWGLCEHILHD